MRHLSFIVLAAAIFSVGCSHGQKKSEAPPEAKAAAAAPAEKAKTETAKATESSTKVECAVKGDSRILEARAKGNGCELAYTKAGKEGIVASAAHGTAYCETALGKLRDKLKGSGYECK
ncbi:MAG: hypothetical protein ACXVA9_03330 [Bdellovibrionales bacterium]